MPKQKQGERLPAGAARGAPAHWRPLLRLLDAADDLGGADPLGVVRADNGGTLVVVQLGAWRLRGG